MDGGDSKDAGRDSRKVPLPALFFLLIALIRLPVMIAHQDTWYPFEVHSGTIAQALLSGFDLDVAHLPIVPHIRGGVVFGILLVPIYAILGASAFSMKLLPILWHASTIALLVHLIEASGRRRAALFAGALFCAAPPMLAKLSTVGLGSHLESMLPFLLAIAAWQRAARQGAGWMSAVVLGIAIGFAGFFHLQALLPCLPIVGIYALSELRNARFRLLGLALGIAVGAAPSFLFVGGNFNLLKASFAHQSANESSSVGESKLDVVDDLTAPPPPAEKVATLLTNDFAFALEFGEIRAGLGVLLGSVYSLLALVLGGIGLAIDRRWASCLGTTLRLRRVEPPLELIFVAHMGLVILLYVFSHARHQEEVGAGLTNRHLAPAIFSLITVAALGAHTIPSGRWLVSPLVLLGLVALPSISVSTAANRLPQRGECLEWVTAILDIHEQPVALWRSITTKDLGDPAFRSMRYPLGFAQTSPDDPDFAKKEARTASQLPRPAALAALLSAGRKFTPRMMVGYATISSLPFRDFDGQETSAFFHGVGLSLRPPRIADPNASRQAFVTQLQRIGRSTNESQMRAIMEGIGFQVGSVFEPYNANLATQLREFSELPNALRPGFVTGLGWGARQRYRVPPLAVPDDLVIRSYLNPADLPQFDLAFCGQILPIESSHDR